MERTHPWLNRFRKLLVSFEKTEQSIRCAAVARLSLELLKIDHRFTRISSNNIDSEEFRLANARASQRSNNLAIQVQPHNIHPAMTSRSNGRPV